MGVGGAGGGAGRGEGSDFRIPGDGCVTLISC